MKDQEDPATYILGLQVFRTAVINKSQDDSDIPARGDSGHCFILLGSTTLNGHKKIPFGHQKQFSIMLTP